jgi:hypothetical protein
MRIEITKPEENKKALWIVSHKHNKQRGHLRQVEILKFLTLWKYATIKQLELLTAEKDRNIYKHLSKLEKLELIKREKYYTFSIVSITRTGIELIAELTGIKPELLITKENYKKQISFLEHQLMLRGFAIRLYAKNKQIIIPFSVYLKALYRMFKGNEKVVSKIHRADFVILKKEQENINLIGFEYENSYKKRDQLVKKFKSMKENLEFYEGYFITTKNANIYERTRRTLFEESKKSYEISKLYKATNLSTNDLLTIEKSTQVNEQVKNVAIELYKAFSKYDELSEIPLLKKKIAFPTQTTKSPSESIDI